MTLFGKARIMSVVFFVFAVVFMFMLSDGCKAKPKVFTIGIVNGLSTLSPCLDGLKAGMSEFGHIEDHDIKYIYNGLIKENQESVNSEIERLLSQNIDLLFVTGTNMTMMVMNSLKNNEVPIVFAASGYLEEVGLMKNRDISGRNITGVQTFNVMPKTIEWLKLIKPHIKRVYLPYNPNDLLSTIIVKSLNDKVHGLEIEYVKQEIHSVEDTVKAIENLPEDIDAILRIPSPTLDPRNSELSDAAIKRGLPMVSSIPLDRDVLMSFSTDFYMMGRQAARLVHQIFTGVLAGNLPIETSEFFLTVNLKTADKLGIQVPNDVLIQAKTIIRD